jgi:sigma-B regulation protein RsbU (phosphoserine phosphatase)
VIEFANLRDLLHRYTQEQSKNEELLNFLGYALRGFNNINQFLELTPLIASRVTDADGGALILFKGSGQMRLESLHCHENGKMQQRNVRIAIEHAMQKVFTGNTNALDEMMSRYLGADVYLFGTSILVKSVVRGRLYIFSLKQDYALTQKKETLMRVVANQTAIGIENHELAQELLKKERQDRELEIGAEIQRQLLPRSFPAIPGIEIAARCLTASRVGGDYYDFIPVQKGERWSFVVGDVMGKGVPAGLIMTMTRGMLRAEVLNNHSPAKILEHLNEVMYDDLEKSNRFVTMFYSEYDPKTQVLTYSNAAHTPALLWRSRTRTVHALDTLGALIGLDANSKFEQSSITLDYGDVVIYYTDGFTEAANAKGDRFDDENLRQALRSACQPTVTTTAQSVLNHIFQKVQEFMGNPGDRLDDMTLLVLRVQPPESR